MQIDRLGATEQRILEVASVAGVTFTAGAVAYALDAEPDDIDSVCETLALARRFLQYVGTETWPDGTIHTRYAFEHALVQHAALARSPSTSVRLWHRKIAERLEAGYAGRADDIASELAVHFDQGQRPAQAARYYVRAGDRAARRFGNVEAVAHFERALALVPTLPEGRDRDVLELHASFGLGQRLFPLRGAGAIPVLERARDLAQRLEDPRLLAAVLTRLQLGRAARGDFRDAALHTTALFQAIDAVAEPALRTSATQTEALIALHRGRFVEAHRLFETLGVHEANVAVSDPAALPLVAAISNAALLLLFTGRPQEALTVQRRAFAIAEASGDPFERAAIYCDWSRLHAWRREPAEAEELAARALALAEEGSFDLWKTRATMVLHWARAHLGTASESMLEATCTQTWESGEAGLTLFAALLVGACVHVGLDKKALEIVEATLTVADRRDERIVVPELYRLRGELLKGRDKAEAERAILSAIDVAREQGSTFLELRATVSLSGLTTGAKKKRARADIVRLLSAFTDGLDVRDVAVAQASLDA
jgi:tetratricopeptide (TPR) repeat protein